MPSRRSQPEQLWFFDKLQTAPLVASDSRWSIATLLSEVPPVINTARHSVGDADEVVRYVRLMEDYYGRVLTDDWQRELKKAQEIIIDAETVTIAGLKVERKNSGSMKEKAAYENRYWVPTLDEWQSIINALPGGEKWHDALKKILDIHIYEKSYWAWDVKEQKMKIVRMSWHNHSRTLNQQRSQDSDQKALIRLIVRDELAQ